MEAIVGTTFAEPQAHHIQVDATEGTIQDLLMLLSPRNGALELRNPKKTHASFRTRKTATLEQFVQGTDYLDQGCRTGDVVVGSQLHIAFEQVGCKDHLLCIRIRTGNDTGGYLQVSILHRRLHLRMYGNLLTSQQTIP